jgi:hypothetical protein
MLQIRKKTNRFRTPAKRVIKKKNTVPNNVSDLIEQVETTMRSISSTSASDTSTEKSNDLHVSKDETNLSNPNMSVDHHSSPKTSSPITKESSNGARDNTSKKNRKANRIYNFIKRFDSKNDCDKFVRSSSKYGYTTR